MYASIFLSQIKPPPLLAQPSSISPSLNTLRDVPKATQYASGTGPVHYPETAEDPSEANWMVSRYTRARKVVSSSSATGSKVRSRSRSPSVVVACGRPALCACRSPVCALSWCRADYQALAVWLLLGRTRVCVGVPGRRVERGRVVRCAESRRCCDARDGMRVNTA